ncbi:MAG: PEP-CTERM sorting domain-containing protein [Gammaproteobacteria bacterium]|nr:PEP-CTERM sorting domain-containing protein [Gammaproteobacteria bacterium]
MASGEVPEPSVLTLMGLGLLVFTIKHQRKQLS